MSSDKQFDVPKNPGKRGESWDGFGIAWQEYAQAQFEMHDDYSLFDVSEGRDQGAVNGPQIAAAGAGQREGISKRKKRQPTSLPAAAAGALLADDRRLPDQDRDVVAPPCSLASWVTQHARGSNPGRTDMCLSRADAD